jgi:CRISPR-associated protein Csm1
MLIVGKISGIQDYLFDVAAEGGAQAKRLRARSFFMQILTETLAIRTALKCKISHKQSLVFCNAGKFALETADADENSVKEALSELSREVNRELLNSTAARLSFSLAVSKLETGSISTDYNEAMRKLNFVKKQAWAKAVTANGVWQTSNLILQSISDPCELCRQEKSVDEIQDDNDVVRRICQTCLMMRDIGKNLTEPNKNWVILAQNENRTFKVGSWSFDFAERPSENSDEYSISLDGSTYSGQRNEEKIYSRRLVRSIPKEANGKPLEFVDLAERAKGDKLLGLLKMDADSLGKHIDDLNKKAASLNDLKGFSQELDDFFAQTLTEKLKRTNIYTVFAGGDDLMLVGAWNEIFDFAGEIQKAFASQFGNRGLTISGGLAIFKPKTPIKNVAAEAEELLHKAKETEIDGKNRNQFAAFGQVWKWEAHTEITDTANQIIGWIEENKFNRGWLNTLLRLAMMREKDPNSFESRLATARLANYWIRNFKNPEVWEFGKNLVNEFDEMKTVKTRYLATIVRYVLTATRNRAKEEI